MPRTSRPRKGSLQFYPRKRIEKRVPSVNWKVVSGEGILGFITYKVGMASAIVKDNTANSMTKGKKIVIPVTILEAPSMKIFSVRFYKNGKVLKDVVVSNDEDLKRVLKVPKEIKPFDSQVPEGYDNITAIVYSIPKQTSVKKTPDISEIALGNTNKLEFVKSLIGKELSLSDFAKTELLDVRALTKGKGLVGPVKRFGITLKQHKSEKGVRRPGSLAPWKPSRVTFRTPMAGQLGMFTRIHYNLKNIISGNIKERDINPSSGFMHYGKIRSGYIIVKGSVQGPSKRQVLVTPSFRPSKDTTKHKYEFMELLT
jgi:large subunit ribosomal protein L3